MESESAGHRGWERRAVVRQQACQDEWLARTAVSGGTAAVRCARAHRESVRPRPPPLPPSTIREGALLHYLHPRMQWQWLEDVDATLPEDLSPEARQA